MNRVLKRPMFKMGGSTGTGITSGLGNTQELRPGFKNGTPFNVEEDAQRRIDLINQFAPRMTSAFSPGSLSGFLTNTGLNLLSAVPRGNIFATTAGAAKEPFDAFTAAKGRESAEDRALAMSAAQTAISRGDTLSDLTRKEAFEEKMTQRAADASMKKTKMLIDADIALVDQEHANEIEKIELEAQLGTGDATTYAKKQASDAYKATFSPELEKLNKLISDTEDPDIRSQYESQKTALLNKIIRGQQSIYLGQQTDVEFSRDVILKILQGAATAGNLEDQEGITDIFNAISTIYPNYKEILGPDFKLPQPMADGGRAGYNVGGMTNPVAATQQQAQVQDLSYSELRSRLPESINNDVVNILANSKQALLDFANIRDQQDVDEFNQRYNVNLTIPQEG